MLLESAAAHGFEPPTPPDSMGQERPNLLVFSAKHPTSLIRSVDNHASYLSSHPDSRNDMSYTLSTKRQKLSHRVFCIASQEDPLEPSRINRPAGILNVIFTFTGQGAQWARMGRELITKEPSFKRSISRLDKVLSSLSEAPSWSLQGRSSKNTMHPKFWPTLD